jgi:hypothetical protein
LLIFIVLTAAMFGYVPTIGNSIKWKDILPDISPEITISSIKILTLNYLIIVGAGNL